MWKAKVPPSLIISQMKAAKTQFDLSTEWRHQAVAGRPAGIPRGSDAQSGEGEGPSFRAEYSDRASARTGAAPSIPAPAPPKAAEAPALPAAKPPHRNRRRDTVRDHPDGKRAVDRDPAPQSGFQAAEGLKVDQKDVIAKGAAVVGTIVDAAKKKLLRDSKVTFRLEYAEAVDGSKVRLRTAVKAGTAAARLEHPKYSAGRETLPPRALPTPSISMANRRWLSAEDACGAGTRACRVAPSAAPASFLLRRSGCPRPAIGCLGGEGGMHRCQARGPRNVGTA